MTNAFGLPTYCPSDGQAGPLLLAPGFSFCLIRKRETVEVALWVDVERPGKGQARQSEQSRECPCASSDTWYGCFRPTGLGSTTRRQAEYMSMQ